MKYLTIFIFLLAVLPLFAQETETSDQQAIEESVQQFFKALETGDTVLFKQLSALDGQIWTRRVVDGTAKIGMRLLGDDLKRLPSMPTLEEKALDIQINIHGGIATAWVPYEFWLKGEFSHCGIDVFTFLKKDGQWKVVSLAYTIEKSGCEALKK